MFALSAMKEGGYAIYMVADASGGTSVDAQKYAMDRMVQAGVVPVTWQKVLLEWQRDGARKDTYDEAELTFSRSSPTLVIADHTFAPDSMRGMGVAHAHVERLVADARTEGFKIFPLCSYVKAQYQRHAEWADVMQG